MITVFCQKCRSELLVSNRDVEDGIADGSMIEGELVFQQRVGSGPNDTRDVYVKAVLYICKTCQRTARAEARAKVAAVPPAPLTIEQESREIQRLVDSIRAFFPEWDLAAVTHEAVERFNDVRKLKDEGFRKYLIEMDRA